MPITYKHKGYSYYVVNVRGYWSAMIYKNGKRIACLNGNEREGHANFVAKEWIENKIEKERQLQAEAVEYYDKIFCEGQKEDE